MTNDNSNLAINEKPNIERPNSEKSENSKDSELKTKFKDFFCKERVQRILPIILLALGLSIIIFISSPLDIFANNVEEFRVELNRFIGLLILFAILSALLIFAVLFVLPKNLYFVVYSILVLILFTLFVQGNYLNFGVHSLTGDNLLSEFSTTLVVSNTMIWFVVFFISIYLVVKLKKKDIIKTICLVLSIVVLATQLISAILIPFSGKELNKSFYENADGAYNFLTTKNMTNISKNKNIIFFVIDRFDAEYFAEPMMELYPEIFSNLTGFTYFSDNISRYCRTYPGILNLLTMNRNESGAYREDFFKESYENADTLKGLAENGYKINIYADSYFSYSYNTELPEYIENAYNGKIDVKIENNFELAMIFVGMGLYRNLPFAFKYIFDSFSSTTVIEKIILKLSGQDEYIYETTNNVVYDYLSSREFSLVDDKLFTFVHISGCHNSLIRSQIKDIKYDMTTSMSILNFYIDSLKKYGVYEDATIIITGDHGSPNQVDFDFKELLKQIRTALYFKPSGSGDGELKISTAQVCHDNIWASIYKSEGLENYSDFGTSLFDVPEGAILERTFIFDIFLERGKKWKQNCFKIVGNSNDFKNWELVSSIIYDKNFYE